MPDAAADQGQLVDLETLAGTAPGSQTASAQLALDLLDGDVQTGGQALHHDHEAHGETRREIPQHRVEATGRPAPPRRRRGSHGVHVGIRPIHRSCWSAA